MTVTVTKDGAVWLVVIGRPHVKNAVDRDTAAALAEAFRAFDDDADSRVAVLAGEGGTFCAGADLKAIAMGNGNRTEPEGDGPMGPTRLMLSKPVIAAIDGHAVGGGMELALWCDLRVMEEDAVMGFLNRRWGVPLIDGGTVRLPRLIGMSRAMDLILTGREVHALEAERFGLVNRIAPRGGARRVALELATAISQAPWASLVNDRLSALEGGSLVFDDAMRNEFLRGQAALSGSAIQGAKQFARRREL